jgi:F-type H+-transporting ATPase subunit alpha
VPIEDVRRFEAEFLDYLKRTHAGILTGIRETLDLPEEAITALKDAIEDFRRVFETSSGGLLVGDEEQVEALEHEGQETVARRRPEPPAAER